MLPPLCFVQLLLPDIVVSFYFGVCIVRLFCFTRPALRLLSQFLLLLLFLLLLRCLLLAAAVSYLYPVGYTAPRTHLCLLARVHFHFISVIAKLFVLNIFFSVLFACYAAIVSFRCLCCCVAVAAVVLGGFCTLPKLFVAIISGTLYARCHYCTCFLYGTGKHKNVCICI